MGLSCRRCGESVQPVSFDLSPRPIAFEPEANGCLAWDGALNEAYFSPVWTVVKMVNNLILAHLNRPAWLRERSGCRQGSEPPFLWQM